MTNAILITNAHILGGRVGWLLCNEHSIRAIGYGQAPALDDTRIIEAEGLSLLPGFVDIHVHGAIGYETMDATVESLHSQARYFAQHGVTSFLATTWTDPHQQILDALWNVAAIQETPEYGANILGVHLEGPYINEEKSGAQKKEDIRRANHQQVQTILDTDIVRLVTVAPEFKENELLIRECVKRNIPVSLGHTTATYEQVKQAINLGVSGVTHTFNAMTGLHHRTPNTVGGVLTSNELYCEVIADNIHVHPAVMKILYLCKGRHKVILVTDATRVTGLPDGEYQINERVVILRNKTARLADGTLAGSTLTMDRALYNFMKAVEEPLEVIWPTSSLNAASSIGISNSKGSLEVGKDADLVLVDTEINVYLTIVGGQIVYRNTRELRDIYA